MAPSARARPSPFDKFTNASASAVATGFSQALALGPQPKGLQESEGADWLRNLQHVSGLYTEPSQFLAKQSGGGGGGGGEVGVSGQFDDLSDSEGDSDDGATAAAATSSGKRPAKKRGRGGGKAAGASARKNYSMTDKAGNGAPEESAASLRKAQNRLAQREFRQRKQQYIRALEARVELLSSDHDTQVDRLRYALRGLLAENNQLRQILASFASFIGLQQIGGPLQKAGVSRNELEELIFSSAEKVMTEAWQDWPGAKECEALRQIRLESNLPPEGLPESNKPRGEQSKGNKQDAVGTPDTPSSVAKPESAKSRSGQKRKASTSEDKPRPVPVQQDSLADSSTTSSEQPPAAFVPSNSIGGDTSQALASFFANGPQVFNTPQITPGGFTFTPGLTTPGSTFTQPQESNALLASLFGSSGMAGFAASSAGPVANPYVPTPPMDFSINGIVQPRQRTIAGADEPEEIRRINVMVLQLKKERDRYGAGKDPVELDAIADALHSLIRQMANFRRQPSYQLPVVLEPSEIQQTRPHDPLIDCLPFPGVRRNLIAQQDTLVIDDVVLSILHFSKLHSGDITEEANWELLHGFLINYPQLVDQKTLDNANRWRRNRKESSLTFDDIAPGHV